MRTLILLPLSLLTVYGCGSYFQPDRNIPETLVPQQVVGTWTLTPESLVLLQRKGFHSSPQHAYSIEIKVDGTCSFQSVTVGKAKAIYKEQSGTWVLRANVRESHGNKANELLLEFRTSTETAAEGLNFTRVDGMLRMFQGFGDPDLFEFIEYVRKP